MSLAPACQDVGNSPTVEKSGIPARRVTGPELKTLRERAYPVKARFIDLLAAQFPGVEKGTIRRAVDRWESGSVEHPSGPYFYWAAEHLTGSTYGLTLDDIAVRLGGIEEAVARILDILVKQDESFADGAWAVNRFDAEALGELRGIIRDVIAGEGAA